MKHFVLTLIAATALCSQVSAQSKVKSMSANTLKLDVEQLKNDGQQVRLSRHLFAGYNTLCLPMSMTADQLAEAAKDLKVERLVAIKQTGATLNLYFVECTEDGIEAGVPYLIYSPTTQTMNVVNTKSMKINTELKVIRLKDDNGNQISFGSGWENIKKAGRYGIPAQQDVTPLESVLIKTDADKNFLPTRCGFTWDEQASTATDLKIQHLANMSEVTAVTGIKKSQIEGAEYYDLSGRKVNGTMKKGVYVVGGEKVESHQITTDDYLQSLHPSHLFSSPRKRFSTR